MTKEKKPVKQLTRRGFVGGTVASAGLVGLTVAANVAGNMFGSGLDGRFGRGAVKVEKAQGTENWDTQYYKKEYGSQAEAKAASDKVSEQVTDEGIVLLKNDGVLPLASGAEVTPFGYGYLNPAYSGSGAAASTDDTMVTVDAALGNHLAVNNAAVDLMNANEPSYPGAAAGTDALDFDTNSLDAKRDAGESAKIYEYDPSIYSSISGVEGSTALVYIKRTGSEGLDKRYEAYDDGTAHYLALSQNELGTIAAAKAACGKVVVVLNSANPMELAPVMAGDYEADAIVWVGTAGSRGFESLAKVLVGEVNPSGRLTDIYATDFTADPTYKNFGRFNYTNSQVTVNALSLGGDGGASIVSDTQPRHFVEYQEGVYEGYRYYETAAEVDPSFVYGELDGMGAIAVPGAVCYPFGYGLSYTTFDQRISSFDDSGDEVHATIEVTNTGSVAGKTVVQLYAASPYTDYDAREGIEKPACELVAFGKTEELQPGGSTQIELSFAKEDLASYDQRHDNLDGTTGCYLLEAGDYVITLRANSHDVLDTKTVNIASEVAYDSSNPRATEVDGQSTLNLDGTSTGATFDGSPVVAATNQLQDITDYMLDGTVTNLSRSDWSGTQPTGYDNREAAKEAPALALQQFDWFENFDPETDSLYGNVPGSAVYADQAPTSNAQNGLSLIDLRGVEYGDDRWNQLLDQIDWDGEKDNIQTLLFGAAYQTKELNCVDKPATTDADGAMGWSSEGSSSWAAANIQAATWNVDLLHQLGSCIGEEALQQGLTGWYAPAINIHRSPFAGRVYEYYSEDPLLSGELAASTISGAADKGVISYLKHFAMNDQETDRSNFLAAWATEQTAREIYLKAFEVAIKDAKTSVSFISDDKGTLSQRTMRATTGLMTAQSCIGGVQGFCHPALQTKILRDEWGYTGAVITDLFFGPHSHDYDLMVRSGGNMYMTVGSTQPVDYTSATARTCMREALHHVLYAIANSNAMNNIAPGSTVTYEMSPWRKALTAGSVVALGGAAAIIGRMVYRKRNGVPAEAAKKKARKATVADGENNDSSMSK